jgi:hypothetical protein
MVAIALNSRGKFAENLHFVIAGVVKLAALGQLAKMPSTG